MKKNIKILIIEDEPVLREMYEQKFSQSGLKIVSAEDGEQGFVVAKNEKPNLILLDMLMPKQGGLDFLRKLRANPDKQLAKTTVIAFSNLDEPNTKKEAAKLNVAEYIIKTNFTPKQVVRKVEKYLALNSKNSD